MEKNLLKKLDEKDSEKFKEELVEQLPLARVSREYELENRLSKYDPEGIDFLGDLGCGCH